MDYFWDDENRPSLLPKRDSIFQGNLGMLYEAKAQDRVA